MEYYTKFRKSLSVEIKTPTKTSRIYIRKQNTTNSLINENSNNNKKNSLIIFETFDKKVALYLKNELDYIDFNKIKENFESFKKEFPRIENDDSKNIKSNENLRDTELDPKLEYTNIKLGETRDVLTHNLICQDDFFYKENKDFLSNDKLSKDSSLIRFKDKNKDLKIKHNLRIKSKTSREESGNIKRFYNNMINKIGYEKNKSKNKNKRLMSSKTFHKNNLDNTQFYNITSKKSILSNSISKDLEEINKLSSNSIIATIPYIHSTPSLEKENMTSINIEEKTINSTRIINPIFILCVICDITMHENNFINISKLCKHKICFKCTKIFYEDKIESCEYPLLCPVYKCKKIIESDELIEIIVSRVHYENYKQIKKESGSSKIITGLNEYEKDNKINKGKKLALLTLENVNDSNSRNCSSNVNVDKKSVVDSLKVYSKRHIISISNINTYINFIKTKELFCPNCNEPSLFGKVPSNNIKCLNCFAKICKFCFNEVTNDHFDVTTQNYCKEYRKKLNVRKLNKNLMRKNLSFAKRILECLLFQTFSFCLLVAYLNNILTLRNLLICKIQRKKFSSNNRKILSYRIINWSISLIFCCINFSYRIVIFLIVLLVSIFLFPYFRLINEIVR